MFLLDTNIISELRKKQPNSCLIERMEDVPDASLYTASVCAMELRFGALRYGLPFMVPYLFHSTRVFS
jgi:predicted nucleic acid-binding protein